MTEDDDGNEVRILKSKTSYPFFAYFIQHPDRSLETVKQWLAEGEKLSTEFGYKLFDRIILRNPQYRKAVDALITSKNK